MTMREQAFINLEWSFEVRLLALMEGAKPSLVQLVNNPAYLQALEVLESGVKGRCLLIDLTQPMQ